MKQEYYFRPLIPLLPALVSGIFLGTACPGHLLLASGTALFAGAVLIRCLVLKNRTSFLPFILFFLVGYLSIQPWAAPRFPENHVMRFIGSEKWRIFGVIDEATRQGEGRGSFVLGKLFLKKTAGKSESEFPVAGKIRVTIWEKPPDMMVGDTAFMTARLRPVKNFNNPGGFNYRRYLAFKGIWATAYVSGKDLVVRREDTRTSISGKIAAARQDLSRFIDERISIKKMPEARAVLKALVLGDRGELSARLRDAFNRTGVSHILAISGLHIGIVAAGAFGLFARLLSGFRIFLWHAWTRKGAALFSLFPVLIYGVLSGMSPSTQRAVIMVGVFLLAFFFEREHEPFNTLAAAALGILLFDPPALFSVSFQLSFASVFWILFGMWKTKRLWIGPRGENPEALFPRIRRLFFSFFMVSAFAVIGTLPIVMMYFNQVSLVSLAANMVVIPLVGFVAVPAGLMAVFCFPIHLQAAAFCLKISSMVIESAIRAVHFFSDLPFASLKTFTPSSLEIVLFYAAIWALFGLAKRPESPSTAPTEESFIPFIRHFKRVPSVRLKAGLALGVVLAIGAVDIAYWLHYRLWHKDLRISIIDVGQGSAALVEFPKGYNLLIDGGGFSDNTVFDVGAHVVAPFLWRHKILSLDAVALSHPNSDHLNGLVYIAQNFRVKALWTNGESEDSREYRRLMEIVQEKGIPMPGYKRIPRFSRIHGVAVEILYPPPEYPVLRKKDRWRKTNNNSMVVRIQFGDHAFLFPGDIMERAEEELVDRVGDGIRSTLMVAPHHGSKTSSTSGFLEAVHPQYIVVSTGNREPHPEVLARYHRLGAKVYSTHRHGAIRIHSHDGKLKIRQTCGGIQPAIEEKPRF